MYYSLPTAGPCLGGIKNRWQNQNKPDKKAARDDRCR